MKKFLLLIAVMFICSAASAQLFKKKSTVAEPQYQTGTVPVVNGRSHLKKLYRPKGLVQQRLPTKSTVGSKAATLSLQ